MINKREKSFLAIEFASSGVKVVKMKEGARGLELLEAQTVSLPLENGRQVTESSWKEAVLQLISHERLEDYRLFLSINDPHTCFSQFVLPKIPKKEVAGTLKWKMKDDIPYPVEEAALDYRLFEIAGNEKQRHCSALVAALPRNVIDRFYKLLPTGKSELFAAAFVPFSIASLSNAFSISEGELVVVVDIGHSITEIAFYAEGKLSFLRKIAFGSYALSQSLTQPLMSEKGSLALTFEEAEQAKKNEDLLDATSQKLVAGKIEASKLFALIRPELEKLSQEIERSLDYYTQEHGSTETRIFLTGGGSHLKGLAKFLAQNIGTPISDVNVARDVVIAEPLQNGNLDPYYRLVALVLDRKDVYRSNFSFLVDSCQRFVQSVSYAQVGITMFFLYLVLAAGMSWRYFEAVQKTHDLRRQIANLKSGFSEARKIQTIESQINQGAILASAIQTTEPYWDEVFRELAHVFPDNVLLTGISYDQNSFVLSGKILSADRDTSVSKLLLAIEGPIFQKVALVNTEQHEDSISFTIRARSGKP